MATRIYRCNPQDKPQDVTEAAGAATTKLVEVTVDWDTMIANGLSGQQARLQVGLAFEKVMSYIEQTGKFNVNA